MEHVRVQFVITVEVPMDDVEGNEMTVDEMKEELRTYAEDVIESADRTGIFNIFIENEIEQTNKGEK